MKVYLVRHGDALSEDEDPIRPLSDKGRRDVGKIAKFLDKNGIRVDRIIHSGRTRAEQTAAILADAVGVGVTITQQDGIAPNDAIEPFANQLREWKRDIMVVGHLPFQALLVAYCVYGHASGAITAFEPGTIVCLEEVDTNGGWRIGWALTPSVLAD